MLHNCVQIQNNIFIVMRTPIDLIRMFRYLCFLGLFFVVGLADLQAQQLAFPSAEGYGRFAEGGRGGDVYTVTNLNDGGEGSFRYGIDYMDGPRTIVFAVSGTIELKSAINIRSSYLTIAGQTAPGDGICLKDYGLKFNDVHDIIMRYIRIRYGDKNKSGLTGDDCITTNDVSDIIFDHISSGWGIDAIHDLRRDGNFTLQWSIYGETLHNSIHYKESGHSKLASFRALTKNISLHHNLLHSTNDRHPTLGGAASKNDVIIDFRNNLIYNANAKTNFGSSQLNVINNYYKNGPSTDISAYPMRIKSDVGAGDPTGFVSGNVFVWNQGWTNDNYAAIDYESEPGGSYISTSREAWELPAELVFGDDKPETQSASEAYDLVLLHAGASKSRDACDERIIYEVLTGTGRVPDSQNEVGGWPILNSLPAPLDTDHDGMPDDWETENGLNPADTDDRNGDPNLDGYTNLEEFLNSLVTAPTDVLPIVKVLSPVSDTGYLQTDTVFVKAMAADYGGGTIESLELYLDAELISSLAGTALDTFLTGLTTGSHYIIAKATDNGGQVRLDSSKIYVGTKYCTITIDSIVGGGTVFLDPPGGSYIETMEVSLQAIPSFLYEFGSWSGDVTGTDEKVMLTVTEDLSLAAHFDFDTSSVVNINFQPGSSAVPRGYIADIGDEYGMRESGYVYGWMGAENRETRDRGGMEDTRKATLNHMQKNGSAIWEFELPEGTYAVNIHMGDNDYENQVNSIDVEGIEMIDPQTGSVNFDEYLIEVVPVSDGKLTITPLDDAKINFIKIALKESALGHYLIVGDGSGTGEHAVGDTVELVANDPEERHEFREWLGDSEQIADVTAPRTSLVMPDHDLSVHATYAHLIYKLSVINGTGSGEYYPGKLVFLTSSAPPEGQIFSAWVPENNEVVGIVNKNAPSTWFTMPAHDVKVTASYEEAVSAWSPEDTEALVLQCYPNPSDGSFFIDLSGMGSSNVVITDLRGQQLYHSIVPEGIHQIDEPGFSPGIYLVRVTGPRGDVRLTKIIIK